MKEIEKQFYEFCKIFDDILTEEDYDGFFSDDIAESSKDNTNDEELK